LKTSDFYFDLPEELIAQFPPENRGTSRLLVLKRDSVAATTNPSVVCGTDAVSIAATKGRDIENGIPTQPLVIPMQPSVIPMQPSVIPMQPSVIPTKVGITHSSVQNFSDFIDENTVIVFNNTKVRKARIFGLSETGTKTEFLLLENVSGNKWKAISSKLKKQKPGKTFTFPANIKCTVIEKDEKGIILEFSSNIDDAYLEKYGHVPLPPYIKREDILSDSERYQTIYCEKTGSAAAPTAGLHFTEEILDNLKKKGITTTFITLHVGMGTFKPIHSDAIENHIMHEEIYEISEETADIINNAKNNGKKIVAIGTTSLRTLESAIFNGKVVPGKGKTSLFIYPGYKFKIVDSLFTNFHTPDSTLIVLVSAFAGISAIKEAYKEAIDKKYRFFSYGDAMLIL